MQSNWLSRINIEHYDFMEINVFSYNSNLTR